MRLGLLMRIMALDWTIVHRVMKLCYIFTVALLALGMPRISLLMVLKDLGTSTILGNCTLLSLRIDNCDA